MTDEEFTQDYIELVKGLASIQRNAVMYKALRTIKELFEDSPSDDQLASAAYLIADNALREDDDENAYQVQETKA